MENYNLKKGRVTLPIEEGIEKEVAEIMRRWGSDAIRNSDGTELTKELTGMANKVYATYKLTRNDQEWAKNHKDQLQQLYLMSEPVTAESETIEIDLLKGYFNEQFEIDQIHDEKKWWEVIDRTTGEKVESSTWDYDENAGTVIIRGAKKWHIYTINFLVYQIWDPTEMYNHITNNWDKEHEMPYDVRNIETREHVLEYLGKWLEKNPNVDVVRFTTFFYHFTLCFNSNANEKYVDWFGYSSSVSPKAFEDFEKEKGYKLYPEDIVDEGYYNTPFRIPSKEFKDYLDFQQKFVSELARKMVDMVHEKGKEAMMFLGDNWIGTEPYGNYFKNIGLDAVVGSVGNGATLRMISDIPGVKYSEGRFLPYFFPDSFYEGGNPTKEAKENWLQARRAILRSPIDRMGYGGYLSLAAKFPDFIECVEGICNEFREIHANIKGTKAYTAPFKVAVLNAWGKLRSWQTNQVAHALWYKDIYSYIGVIEALSGMPVEVDFISFDDIKQNGINEDIGVIINAGDYNTAWSGGEKWIDEKVVTTIREWIFNGGGFIGVGEPTACQHQGRYFQLADVLGVDKEVGFTLSYTKYDKENRNHFITAGYNGNFECGEGMKSIHGISEGANIIYANDKDVMLSTNEFGKGRSVYISGLPYNPQNAKLLLRTLYWTAGKESDIYKWYCTNPLTECAAFLDTGKIVVINNSYEKQVTEVYKDKNNKIVIELEPCISKWINIDQI